MQFGCRWRRRPPPCAFLPQARKQWLIKLASVPGIMDGNCFQSCRNPRCDGCALLLPALGEACTYGRDALNHQTQSIVICHCTRAIATLHTKCAWSRKTRTHPHTAPRSPSSTPVYICPPTHPPNPTHPPTHPPSQPTRPLAHPSTPTTF